MPSGGRTGGGNATTYANGNQMFDNKQCETWQRERDKIYVKGLSRVDFEKENILPTVAFYFSLYFICI